MPEPQYQRAFSLKSIHAPIELPAVSTQRWLEDPRMLAITMARYKHCAKLLHGQYLVAEIGCGDQFCTPLIRQEVGRLITVDFDNAFKPDILHDMTAAPLRFLFNAAYSLDVIEHIAPDCQDAFVENVARSLLPHGVYVVGTPNKTAEPWASADTKRGHVGWLGHDELRALMGRHFHNVLMLGMNDETLHTGFGPMCHYLLAIGVEQR